MKERILLTGHKGFIGSHLFKQGFVGRDIKVTPQDDICFPIHGEYDVIINCAAEMFVGGKMVWTNVLGVENLIRHAKKWNAKLIHFSTVGIYGKGFYGLTKRIGEDLIEFHNSPDWTILRLTNVYGPGGSSPACQFERGEKVIFGDGEHYKDHIHVRDVVAAVEMAIADNWKGDINLSSGKSHSINEVFKIFGKGTPIYERDKIPDIQVSILDNSAAKKLGWKPTWTIHGDIDD